MRETNSVILAVKGPVQVFYIDRGSSSSSTGSTMSHCHVPTGAQDGQITHRLWRGTPDEGYSVSRCHLISPHWSFRAAVFWDIKSVNASIHAVSCNLITQLSSGPAAAFVLSLTELLEHYLTNDLCGRESIDLCG